MARRHFIAKTYLRQWAITDKNGNISKPIQFYVYDYLNGEFLESSTRKTKEDMHLIDLNDRIFQKENLYSEELENYFQGIENDYPENIKKIIYILNKYKNTNISVADSEALLNLSIYFIKFLYCQWLRHPTELILREKNEEFQERDILFEFFRDFMLKDETHFFDLYTNPEFKINPTGGTGGLFSTYEGDKDIYEYGLNFIDLNKVNNFIGGNYKILISYSPKGGILTTTKPVFPIMKDSKVHSVAIPLSQNILFEVVHKGEAIKHKLDSAINITYLNNKNLYKINEKICFSNYNAKVVANSNYEARKQFVGRKTKDIIEKNEKIKNRHLTLVKSVNNYNVIDMRCSGLSDENYDTYKSITQKYLEENLYKFKNKELENQIENIICLMSQDFYYHYENNEKFSNLLDSLSEKDFNLLLSIMDKIDNIYLNI